MAAAILERTGETLVHNRAGANMAGGVASALAAASRRGGRELDGELGLFEVDEFWLGAGRRGARAARAAARRTCSATSSTATASSEIIADRWAEVVAAHAGATALVLNADDPLVADLGRDARRRSTSASTTTRWRSPSCSTRPTPSTAAAAATPTPTRRSTSPTSAATHCPNCGARRPRAGRRGARRRAARHPLGRVHARHAGRQRARRAAAARPLQRLQRARRRGAVPRAWARGSTRWSRGCRRSRRRSGGPRRSTLGGRPTSILLVKNPAGANEVLRTLALEGEQLDLFGVLNDNTADGRDVSWVWDADWELLAPLRAAYDVLGHARGGAGAAAEVRGRRRGAADASCRTCRPGSTRRSRTATGRCTRCRPTPRCSSCATCSPGAATSQGHWR